MILLKIDSNIDMTSIKYGKTSAYVLMQTSAWLVDSSDSYRQRKDGNHYVSRVGNMESFDCYKRKHMPIYDFIKDNI